MGIRGIDVQVAIQRATDADKLQQADAAHGRAGEAVAREEARKERIQKQEQPQQTQKTDQAVIQSRRDREGREQENQDTEDSSSEEETALTGTEYDNPDKAVERKKSAKRPNPSRRKGHLDILA